MRFSGITPSGHAHLGNHLGAVRRWTAESSPVDLYFVSDLHAMTTAHDPARLRALTGELLAVLLASGIPPAQVFVQSDLARELGALTWVLECTAGYGEAARMIQFKEKARGRAQAGVRLSLLTYPVLMAADILLQGASEVPVGEDQRQHVELARALARRFNTTYGEVFVVPRAILPPTGARVRDLSDPARKMSKSTPSARPTGSTGPTPSTGATGDVGGVVFVMDEPDHIRRKIRRAVTDGLGEPAYDPAARPGVANLLEILAACTGGDPRALAGEHTHCGALKDAVAEAVIETLRPVREGTRALLADPAELDRVRRQGAGLATERGEHRLRRALRLIGAG
jgi:tryptophanyl-tRNA synthetase